MTTCLSPTRIKLVFLLLILSLSCLPVRAQLPKAEVDSLQKELAKTGADSNRVKLLMELGNLVGYYDAGMAMKYATEGFELSKKIKYGIGIGRTSYLIGTTHMDMGQFQPSMTMLNYAESTFLSINKPERLGMINTARGNWYYMQSDYRNAAFYYTKATEIFDSYRDTVNSMAVYQNLVSSFSQIKNYEKAITMAKKVLDYAYKNSDTLQMAYTLQNLTTSLIYSNKLEEAKPYLESLLVVIRNSIDNNIVAESYNTAATYYYHKKEYDTAVSYLNQALKKVEDIRNNYQVPNYKTSLGINYLRMGKLELAKQYLTEAAAQAKELNNNDVYFNTSLYLSQYYEQIKDYPKAYNYLRQYTKLNDSILIEETRQYTSQLEAVYEANKKETEILRLKTVEQEKTFAIRKRNTYLIITAGLLALLGIIMGLLVKNNRNKQRAMEKHQQVTSLQSMINGQETERTRIARDLHDGLGGVFSTVKMHYSTLQQETPEVKNNPLYKKTLDLISNASDELRKVAHNMMPEVLMKVGLTEALQDFCNNISAGKLLNVTLQTYGMEKRLSASTEIMLYRIIQELVNNIIKHASATEAIIQINRQDNRLSLTIEDNGRGFDTKEAEEKRSMGMATVKSRVDYLNGKLTIDSRKDIGTTVMIDLLLNEN